MATDLARCDARLQAEVRKLHRTIDPSDRADIREDIDDLLDLRVTLTQRDLVSEIAGRDPNAAHSA